MVTYTDTETLSRAVEEQLFEKEFPTKCFYCESSHLRLTHGHARITLFCGKCGRTNDAVTPYATDANYALEVAEKAGIHRVDDLNTQTFCIAICLAALRSVGHECEYKPESK